MTASAQRKLPLRHAIALGLLPRLEIRHTSEEHEGQIYMPRINSSLLVGVLLLVALFRSSEALASAYGIAVTGTMVVTAIMAFVVVGIVYAIVRRRTRGGSAETPESIEPAPDAS